MIDPLLATSGARTKHYRRLLTLTYGPLDPPNQPHATTIYEYIRDMFDQYMSGQAEAGRAYRLFEAKLRLEVATLIGGKARAHHILLDVPDPRIEAPMGFFVYQDERVSGRDESFLSSAPITDRSTLHKEFLQDWKRHARKIRVYVCPTIDDTDIRARLESQRNKLAGMIADLARDIHNRQSIDETEVEKAWGALPASVPNGLPMAV